MRWNLPTLILCLSSMATLANAAEECDQVADLADHWDESAEWIDGAMVYGLSEDDIAELEARLAESSRASLDLATGLLEGGDRHWTARGEQLAAAVGTVDGLLEADADGDQILAAMDSLIDLLDTIVDECDAQVGGATAEPGSRPAAGSIRVSYGPAAGPEQRELALALADTGFFEALADEAATELILPRSLSVEFASCGQPNAAYFPGEDRMLMCYELFEQFAGIFAAPGTTDEELGNAMLGAGTFVFLHELGHALVDILDLPITGREEDSVDGLATWVLLETGRSDAALAAVDWFAANAQAHEAGQLDLPFWDEHSLNSQRAYDVTCTVYGSDPRVYAGLVTEGFLPEERAVRCPGEYERKQRAWNEILDPYFAN